MMQITPKPLCRTFHFWVTSIFTMKYKWSSGIIGELNHEPCNGIPLMKPVGRHSLYTQYEKKKLLLG